MDHQEKSLDEYLEILDAQPSENQSPLSIYDSSQQSLYHQELQSFARQTQELVYNPAIRPLLARLHVSTHPNASALINELEDVYAGFKPEFTKLRLHLHQDDERVRRIDTKILLFGQAQDSRQEDSFAVAYASSWPEAGSMRKQFTGPVIAYQFQAHYDRQSGRRYDYGTCEIKNLPSFTRAVDPSSETAVLPRQVIEALRA